MNELVREWFRVHTEFLYTLIYKNHLLYIDFWSLVHTWSGLLLFTLLIANGVKRKWFWFFFLIVIYEATEVAFIYFALHMFRPERLNDQVIDVFVGAFAAGICYFTLLYKSGEKRVVYLPTWILMIFSSVTFAFVWVGNYQYAYNYGILNTNGINLWAFLLWLAGGFGLLKIYVFIKGREINVIKQLIYSWTIYVVSLLILECIGYYGFKIREVSVDNPEVLIFGILHGNRALFIYYAVFPFLVIPFYVLLSKQVYKAQFNLAKLTVKS